MDRVFGTASRLGGGRSLAVRPSPRPVAVGCAGRARRGTRLNGSSISAMASTSSSSTRATPSALMRARRAPSTSGVSSTLCSASISSSGVRVAFLSRPAASAASKSICETPAGSDVGFHRNKSVTFAVGAAIGRAFYGRRRVVVHRRHRPAPSSLFWLPFHEPRYQPIRGSAYRGRIFEFSQPEAYLCRGRRAGSCHDSPRPRDAFSSSVKARRTASCKVSTRGRLTRSTGSPKSGSPTSGSSTVIRRSSPATSGEAEVMASCRSSCSHQGQERLALEWIGEEHRLQTVGHFLRPVYRQFQSLQSRSSLLHMTRVEAHCHPESFTVVVARVSRRRDLGVRPGRGLDSCAFGRC